MSTTLTFYLCLALWGGEWPFVFNRSAVEFSVGTVGIIAWIYILTVRRYR